MVFSFFKKSPDQSSQKMPERQVARPKVPGTPAAPGASRTAPIPAPTAAVPEKRDLPDLDFAVGGKPALQFPSGKSAVAAPPPVAPVADEFDDGLSVSEFERDFTASSVMAINIDNDDDPVQADVEQAAVLFANGQDKAAQSVLESCARAYGGADAIRLWHMLLDLVQVIGTRAQFDKLGEEFVQTFEISPPAWRTAEPVPVAASGPPVIGLQGVLNDETDSQIAGLMVAVAKKQALRLDLGKLLSCDEAAAKGLAGILKLARKQSVPLALENAASYIERLSGRLVAGQRENENSWLLILELLQRQNLQEVFEEKAVDYAITFEVSPPSWETVLTAPARVLPKTLVAVDEAHYLSGEIKHSRFDDLPAFFELHDHPVLDFSRVTRLDFYSAGQLRNMLETYKQQGKNLVIRNPNHLVAELMGVVGIQKVARIIVPKS